MREEAASSASEGPQCGLSQNGSANGQGSFVEVKAGVMQEALVAFDERAEREHGPRGKLRIGGEVLGAELLRDRRHVLAAEKIDGGLLDQLHRVRMVDHWR